MMSSSTQACVTFEQDLHLFVDHELDDASVQRITEHLAACGGCREYVDDLRTLSALHHDLLDERCDSRGSDRGAAARAVDELASRHELFASITRTLLVEKRGELARLFYELGKAYVLEGNKALSGVLGRKIVPVSKPLDIRGTAARGKQLAREVGELEATSSAGRAPAPESGSLFRRSRELFSSSRRATGGALTKGRRFLEEALALRPDLSEARIYLGVHHQCTGRFDRARLEYRRVYREAADEVHRMMALQLLGNLYAGAHDFDRAIECYSEVVASDVAEREPRFFTAMLNLAVNYAQLGRVESCIRAFSELVLRFPSAVPQTRSLLGRMNDFGSLLAREHALRSHLQREVPTLFAV